MLVFEVLTKGRTCTWKGKTSWAVGSSLPCWQAWRWGGRHLLSECAPEPARPPGAFRRHRPVREARADRWRRWSDATASQRTVSSLMGDTSVKGGERKETRAQRSLVADADRGPRGGGGATRADPALEAWAWARGRGEAQSGSTGARAPCPVCRIPTWRVDGHPFSEFHEVGVLTQLQKLLFLIRLYG